MVKTKRILSDMMIIVVGMLAGRWIFGSLELWKVSIIALWIFVCLWFLWDAADEQERKERKAGTKRAGTISS